MRRFIFGDDVEPMPSAARYWRPRDDVSLQSPRRVRHEYDARLRFRQDAAHGAEMSADISRAGAAGSFMLRLPLGRRLAP